MAAGAAQLLLGRGGEPLSDSEEAVRRARVEGYVQLVDAVCREFHLSRDRIRGVGYPVNAGHGKAALMPPILQEYPGAELEVTEKTTAAYVDSLTCLCGEDLCLDETIWKIIVGRLVVLRDGFRRRIRTTLKGPLLPIERAALESQGWLRYGTAASGRKDAEVSWIDIFKGVNGVKEELSRRVEIDSDVAMFTPRGVQTGWSRVIGVRATRLMACHVEGEEEVSRGAHLSGPAQKLMVASSLAQLYLAQALRAVEIAMKGEQQGMPKVLPTMNALLEATTMLSEDCYDMEHWMLEDLSRRRVELEDLGLDRAGEFRKSEAAKERLEHIVDKDAPRRQGQRKDMANRVATSWPVVEKVLQERNAEASRAAAAQAAAEVEKDGRGAAAEMMKQASKAVKDATIAPLSLFELAELAGLPSDLLSRLLPHRCEGFLIAKEQQAQAAKEAAEPGQEAASDAESDTTGGAPAEAAPVEVRGPSKSRVMPVYRPKDAELTPGERLVQQHAALLESLRSTQAVVAKRSGRVHDNIIFRLQRAGTREAQRIMDERLEQEGRAKYELWKRLNAARDQLARVQELAREKLKEALERLRTWDLLQQAIALQSKAAAQREAIQARMQRADELEAEIDALRGVILGAVRICSSLNIAPFVLSKTTLLFEEDPFGGRRPEDCPERMAALVSAYLKNRGEDDKQPLPAGCASSVLAQGAVHSPEMARILMHQNVTGGEVFDRLLKAWRARQRAASIRRISAALRMPEPQTPDSTGEPSGPPPWVINDMWEVGWLASCDGPGPRSLILRSPTAYSVPGLEDVIHRSGLEISKPVMPLPRYSNGASQLEWQLSNVEGLAERMARYWRTTLSVEVGGSEFCGPRWLHPLHDVAKAVYRTARALAPAARAVAALESAVTAASQLEAGEGNAQLLTFVSGCVMKRVAWAVISQFNYLAGVLETMRQGINLHSLVWQLSRLQSDAEKTKYTFVHMNTRYTLTEAQCKAFLIAILGGLAALVPLQEGLGQASESETAKAMAEAAEALHLARQLTKSRSAELEKFVLAHASSVGTGCFLEAFEMQQATLRAQLTPFVEMLEDSVEELRAAEEDAREAEANAGTDPRGLFSDGGRDKLAMVSMLADARDALDRIMQLWRLEVVLLAEVSSGAAFRRWRARLKKLLQGSEVGAVSLPGASLQRALTKAMCTPMSRFASVTEALTGPATSLTRLFMRLREGGLKPTGAEEEMEGLPPELAAYAGFRLQLPGSADLKEWASVLSVERKIITGILTTEQKNALLSCVGVRRACGAAEPYLVQEMNPPSGPPPALWGFGRIAGLAFEELLVSGFRGLPKDHMAPRPSRNKASVVSTIADAGPRSEQFSPTASLGSGEGEVSGMEEEAQVGGGTVEAEVQGGAGEAPARNKPARSPRRKTAADGEGGGEAQVDAGLAAGGEASPRRTHFGATAVCKDEEGDEADEPVSGEDHPQRKGSPTPPRLSEAAHSHLNVDGVGSAAEPDEEEGQDDQGRYPYSEADALLGGGNKFWDNALLTSAIRRPKRTMLEVPYPMGSIEPGDYHGLPVCGCGTPWPEGDAFCTMCVTERPMPEEGFPEAQPAGRRQSAGAGGTGAGGGGAGGGEGASAYPWRSGGGGSAGEAGDEAAREQGFASDLPSAKERRSRVTLVGPQGIRLDQGDQQGPDAPEVPSGEADDGTTSAFPGEPRLPTSRRRFAVQLPGSIINMAKPKSVSRDGEEASTGKPSSSSKKHRGQEFHRAGTWASSKDSVRRFGSKEPTGSKGRSGGQGMTVTRSHSANSKSGKSPPLGRRPGLPRRHVTWDVVRTSPDTPEEEEEEASAVVAGRQRPTGAEDVPVEGGPYDAGSRGGSSSSSATGTATTSTESRPSAGGLGLDGEAPPPELLGPPGRHIRPPTPVARRTSGSPASSEDEPAGAEREAAGSKTPSEGGAPKRKKKPAKSLIPSLLGWLPKSTRAKSPRPAPPGASGAGAGGSPGGGKGGDSDSDFGGEEEEEQAQAQAKMAAASAAVTQAVAKLADLSARLKPPAEEIDVQRWNSIKGRIAEQLQQLRAGGGQAAQPAGGGGESGAGDLLHLLSQHEAEEADAAAQLQEAYLEVLQVQQRQEDLARSLAKKFAARLSKKGSESDGLLSSDARASGDAQGSGLPGDPSRAAAGRPSAVALELALQGSMGFGDVVAAIRPPPVSKAVAKWQKGKKRLSEAAAAKAAGAEERLVPTAPPGKPSSKKGGRPGQIGPTRSMPWDVPSLVVHGSTESMSASGEEGRGSFHGRASPASPGRPLAQPRAGKAGAEAGAAEAAAGKAAAAAEPREEGPGAESGPRLEAGPEPGGPTDCSHKVKEANQSGSEFGPAALPDKGPAALGAQRRPSGQERRPSSTVGAASRESAPPKRPQPDGPLMVHSLSEGFPARRSHKAEVREERKIAVSELRDLARQKVEAAALLVKLEKQLAERQERAVKSLHAKLRELAEEEARAVAAAAKVAEEARKAEEMAFAGNVHRQLMESLESFLRAEERSLAAKQERVRQAELEHDEARKKEKDFFEPLRIVQGEDLDPSAEATYRRASTLDDSVRDRPQRLSMRAWNRRLRLYHRDESEWDNLAGQILEDAYLIKTFNWWKRLGQSEKEGETVVERRPSQLSTPPPRIAPQALKPLLLVGPGDQLGGGPALVLSGAAIPIWAQALARKKKLASIEAEKAAKLDRKRRLIQGGRSPLSHSPAVSDNNEDGPSSRRPTKSSRATSKSSRAASKVVPGHGPSPAVPMRRRSSPEAYAAAHLADASGSGSEGEPPWLDGHGAWPRSWGTGRGPRSGREAAARQPSSGNQGWASLWGHTPPSSEGSDSGSASPGPRELMSERLLGVTAGRVAAQRTPGWVLGLAATAATARVRADIEEHAAALAAAAAAAAAGTGRVPPSPLALVGLGQGADVAGAADVIWGSRVFHAIIGVPAAVPQHVRHELAGRWPHEVSDAYVNRRLSELRGGHWSPAPAEELSPTSHVLARVPAVPPDTPFDAGVVYDSAAPHTGFVIRRRSSNRLRSPGLPVLQMPSWTQNLPPDKGAASRPGAASWRTPRAATAALGASTMPRLVDTLPRPMTSRLNPTNSVSTVSLEFSSPVVHSTGRHLIHSASSAPSHGGSTSHLSSAARLPVAASSHLASASSLARVSTAASLQDLAVSEVWRGCVREVRPHTSSIHEAKLFSMDSGGRGGGSASGTGPRQHPPAGSEAREGSPKSRGRLRRPPPGSLGPRPTAVPSVHLAII